MFDDSTVLVAEGDGRLRTCLAAQLDADGATIHVASDAAQARARAATYRPDVLMLGALEAPASAGALLRAVSNSGGARGEPAPDLRVLILVPERDELSILRAFEASVDNVAPRPISYPRLRARLRVLLGMAGNRAVHDPRTRRAGVVELDEASREARLRGTAYARSAKEFALLRRLIADPTRVCSNQQLLRKVWELRAINTTRTLDSHACPLCAKLCVHGDRFVVNVWGVGNRLVDRPAGELEAVA